MLKKTLAAIPGVIMDKPGFKDMTARFALTKDDGMPNYALRIMEFGPGGHTSLHSHLEEHEFYLAEGQAVVLDGQGGETALLPGDVLYTAPNETHQIRNAGSGLMRLVCTIPILPGGDGKKTTQSA